VAAVAGEVPGFARGGRIKDDQIAIWIRSVAQEITAEMLRRGLSLDPATWTAASPAAMPSPADLLEMVNRMGAGARLAAAVGAQFSAGTEWAVAKNLERAYLRHLQALRSGDYDKIFRPTAATVQAGPQLAYADTSDARPAFEKGKVF
jgi:hypothetical protein